MFQNYLIHLFLFYTLIIIPLVRSDDFSNSKSFLNSFKNQLGNKKVVATSLTRTSKINKFLRPFDDLFNYKREVDQTTDLINEDKRDDQTSELSNQVNAFLITVELGSNQNQSFDVILDSGSADLWVPSTKFCDSEGGCTGYNANESSTSVDTGSDYSINYVGSQGYEGEIYNETIGISGIELTDAQFASVDTGDDTQGIIGIGYPSSSNKPSYYKNVPQQMKEQGFIDNFGYGVYLDKIDASNGLIAFGGIFTDGFSGSYKQIPIIEDTSVSSVVSSIYINFANDDDTNAWILQTPIRGLFDTGSTALILPTDMYTKTMNLLGVVDDPDNGNVFECSKYDTSEAGFEFDFLGVNISLPFNVISKTVNDTHCSPSISSIDSDYIILGEFFLRTATLYFDLDNKVISIAQAKLGTDHDTMISNVEEVPESGVTFEKAPNYSETDVSSAPSGTSVTYIGSVASSASDVTTNGSSNASSSSKVSSVLATTSDVAESSSSGSSSSQTSSSQTSSFSSSLITSELSSETPSSSSESSSASGILIGNSDTTITVDPTKTRKSDFTGFPGFNFFNHIKLTTVQTVIAGHTFTELLPEALATGRGLIKNHHNNNNQHNKSKKGGKGKRSEPLENDLNARADSISVMSTTRIITTAVTNTSSTGSSMMPSVTSYDNEAGALTTKWLPLISIVLLMLI